jgi:hypothetical protein
MTHTFANIPLHFNGVSIEGYLMEDGTIQAFDIITKTMKNHQNAIEWARYWAETH